MEERKKKHESNRSWQRRKIFRTEVLIRAGSQHLKQCFALFLSATLALLVTDTTLHSPRWADEQKAAAYP